MSGNAFKDVSTVHNILKKLTVLYLLKKIDSASLSKLESSIGYKNNFTLTTIKNICNALDKTLFDLFEDVYRDFR